MYSTHAYNYIVSTNYMYKYVGCIFVLLQCFEMTHEVIGHIVRVRRQEFVYQQLVYVLVKTAPR